MSGLTMVYALQSLLSILPHHDQEVRFLAIVYACVLSMMLIGKILSTFVP
jgi:hypothetical protein